jgi:large subunit ribosomal protein L21
MGLHCGFVGHFHSLRQVLMYAIIVDGSRQIKVQEGDEIVVDYRDQPAGEKLTFDRVLGVGQESGLKFGSPALAGASVTAEILGPLHGPKLVVQKMRRRKNSRRKTGHRQVQTRVKVTKIIGG